MERKMIKACVVCGCDLTGRHWRAAACSKEHRREYLRAYNQNYREENDAGIREYRRQFYAKNAAAQRQKRRKFYYDNRISCLEYSRQWRIENPDKAREMDRVQGAKRTAKVKLIRELETKGIGALL